MGIREIEQEHCTGCGICETACPMGVIRVDRKAVCAVIAYLRDCQSCYLCERECPESAIRVTPDRERRIPLPW